LQAASVVLGTVPVLPRENHMNYFMPYYVGANQSDIRAIKGGWYAMDDDGKLFSGPFSSREQCIERNAGPANEAMPSRLP
jgi:hypothetical protein